MENNTASLKLFALNSNPELSQKIATELGADLCSASVKHFSDGEIQINIDESVRGADVFVVQSISDPVNENFMELMIMIDALRRASAETINVVIPYYGYARADRKARAREPITAKMVANFVQTAGADRVVSMDLHAVSSKASSIFQSTTCWQFLPKWIISRRLVSTRMLW